MAPTPASTLTVLRVLRVLRGDVLHLDGVAQVWAEATAARDGDLDVAPLELSRPVIARVLGQAGAMLVVALDEQDEVVAFAVARPLAPAGQEPPGTAAEVSYAGVRPDWQGAGLGRRVLQYLASELAAAGFADARLLVYVDNVRAIRLYQRLAWQPRGLPQPHPRTGKPEQRYHLALSS
jgi:ribosomal protein S18 acetylase RimI-like enzyme